MNQHRYLFVITAASALLLPSCETFDFGSVGGGPGTTDPAAPTGVAENDRDRAIHGTSIRRENNLDSKDVPGTDSGNLACAWAVNFVSKEAINREVGGGLSTANMSEALRMGRGVEVPIDEAPPGSVIISPTQFVNGSRNTGHVGVLGAGSGDSRPIYSNSSERAMWEKNFTVGRWREYYEERKGLPMRVYQVNP